MVRCIECGKDDIDTSIFIRKVRGNNPQYIKLHFCSIECRDKYNKNKSCDCEYYNKCTLSKDEYNCTHNGGSYCGMYREFVKEGV